VSSIQVGRLCADRAASFTCGTSQQLRRMRQIGVAAQLRSCAAMRSMNGPCRACRRAIQTRLCCTLYVRRWLCGSCMLSVRTLFGGGCTLFMQGLPVVPGQGGADCLNGIAYDASTDRARLRRICPLRISCPSSSAATSSVSPSLAYSTLPNSDRDAHAHTRTHAYAHTRRPSRASARALATTRTHAVRAHTFVAAPSARLPFENRIAATCSAPMLARAFHHRQVVRAPSRQRAPAGFLSCLRIFVPAQCPRVHACSHTLAAHARMAPICCHLHGWCEVCSVRSVYAG
jgi:hypothetical protein